MDWEPAQGGIVPDQADILRFYCACGAKLKAPSAAIGRRIRCPKCKRAFLVTDPDAPAQVVEPKPKPPRPVRANAPARSPNRPAPSTAAVTSQVALPTPGDELTLADDLTPDVPSKKKNDPAPGGGDDWLNDLAASESEAETTVKSQVAATPHGLDVCANCQKALPVGAKKCPLRGHAKTDPKAKRAKKKTPKSPGDASAGKLAVTTGRFFVGCGLSFVAALVGAGLWLGIAAVTGLEISFAAVGLGALCGYGMVIGYGDQTTMAGLAAAGISLIGLFGAKVLILIYVLYAVFSGNTSDTELQKGNIAFNMTNEACEMRDCSDDEMEKIYQEKLAEVNAMSDAEVKAKWQGYQNQEVDLELDEARSRLAYFRAARRGDQEGLEMGSEMRTEYYDQEYAKLASMSLDDVNAALVEVDAWESEGMKSDAAYARVYLAQHYAGEAIGSDPSMQGDDYDEDVWQKKWDGHYATALAKVDALGPQERIDEAQRITTQKEEELEEMLAKFGEDLSTNGAALAAGAGLAMGAFFLAMFGPLDILFALFALGAAYKIAAGSD